MRSRLPWPRIPAALGHRAHVLGSDKEQGDQGTDLCRHWPDSSAARGPSDEKEHKGRWGGPRGGRFVYDTPLITWVSGLLWVFKVNKVPGLIDLQLMPLEAPPFMGAQTSMVPVSLPPPVLLPCLVPAMRAVLSWPPYLCRSISVSLCLSVSVSLRPCLSLSLSLQLSLSLSHSRLLYCQFSLRSWDPLFHWPSITVGIWLLFTKPKAIFALLFLI